jgi:Ni/Fe-hydrogenase subunit HybB-like protein
MNFKSPLMWDVFAISTYFTVSTVFFYVGLIPDIAAVRDHSKGIVRKVYGSWPRLARHRPPVAPLHGGVRLLRRPRRPARALGALVVSWDFAMAQTAGWHSTIFPPYFVAGAIFSGCAMVITC